MSGGSKKQFKQFAITKIEDALLVLHGLLVPVITDLAKFNAYAHEAEILLEKHKCGDFIAAIEYDSVHDKVLYQQREILRFLADHQSSSFSYIAVRPLLIKKKFLTRKLNEKVESTLKELLDIRNLSFHNPQSMLVADFENAKRLLPAEFADVAELKPLLNPVVIRKIQSYSWDMVSGFVQHNQIRARQFEMVLAEMKLDYQEMYEKLSEPEFVLTNLGMSREVQYIEVDVPHQSIETAGDNVANLSMGIQRGKYDGSDEAFQKIVKNGNT